MPPPSSRRRHALAAGALSGVLLAAATAQVGVGWLAFVGLLPLLRAIASGAGPARAAAAAWLGGVIFFAVGFAWMPLAGFGGVPLLLMGGYVGVIALSWAAVAALLAWLRRHDRMAFLAAAPFVWAAAEYLRSQGTFGDPWHQLGYALAAYPALIQLAAVGGVYALSLWIVAINAAPLALRHASWPARGAVVGALALPLLLGLRPAAPEPGDTLRIAAVQPAVVETGHADRVKFHANLRALLGLTDDVVAGHAPDLVVWPESAYEAEVSLAGDPFLGGVAHHYETPLLTGARRPAGDGRSLYNAAWLADVHGGVSHVGDKVNPVPVYEAAPRSRAERWLASLGAWPGRFRAGERAGLLSLDTGSAAAVPVGVLICVDSSYPMLARDLRRRGARLLIEISNEAQTGAWSAAQHALVSRLRAVENGMPLVRVGNIGPSEWIDARGRTHARLSPGAPGSGSAVVTLAGAPTPFVRLGHGPAFVVALLPPLGALARRRRARSRPRRIRPTLIHSGKGELDMLNSLGSRTWLLLVLVLAPALPALAMDGATISGASSSDPTYYESVQASVSAEQMSSTQVGTPTGLYFSDSTATVTYVKGAAADGSGQVTWTAQVRGLSRPHERVDAVYQMIAVIPLPVDVEGRPLFTRRSVKIEARAGAREDSEPLVYAGETVILKRNITLEKTLLPGLIGPSGSDDKLPSLDGTGYAYTLWDTIISYDPKYGDTVEVFADVSYKTDDWVAGPDGDDERLKAYVITWIPGADPGVYPFAIRMDIE